MWIAKRKHYTRTLAVLNYFPTSNRACRYQKKSTLLSQELPRQKSGRHYEICREPVNDEQLRAMRHKRKCHEHKGHIATCVRCNTRFSINDIVFNALSTHIGNPLQIISFPEGNTVTQSDWTDLHTNWAKSFPVMMMVIQKFQEISQRGSTRKLCGTLPIMP